ncbi:ferredoxin [Mycobacterium sp. HUMS_1102779]
MRIVVDLNRCLGYAQCAPLAPEVLKLSGDEPDEPYDRPPLSK